MASNCQYFWKLQSGIAINHMQLNTPKTAFCKSQKIPLAYVIIPGNPGCIHFYEKFSRVLAANTNVPVWGISHTGHAQATTYDDVAHPETLDCGLESQIQHKIQYLEENVFHHVENVILIGHSVGCYIILQILDRMKERRNNILKCVLLFPTIEKMKHSPQGKKVTPILSNARWLLRFSVSLLRFLPNKVVSWLLPWIVKTNEECIHQAIVDHFTVRVADCCSFMGLHEMYEVDKRDDHIIEKHIDKLIFYYGANDKWCPVSYYHDVVKEHGHRPGSHIQLCENGYEHAFVLNHSSEIAHLVSEWTASFLP